MVRHSKTYVAAPPGFALKEIIDERGISEEQLALQMGQDETFVRDLIEGDVELTEDVANSIEKTLDIPAYFLLNLECLYRKDLVKVATENAKEANNTVPVVSPVQESFAV